MTARVINDPSALGWEYDSTTGRWSWGGGQGGSGDGGSFPEAPVDGKQYGRQNASWTEIVSGGGGSDYDDTQIKADLAKETQDRIDGDANLQNQIDNLSGGGSSYGQWNLRVNGGQAFAVTSGEYVNFEGTGGISVTRSSGYVTIDGSGISGGGGIGEAPNDGAIYGRKNKGWVVVPTSGGGNGPDMSLYYTGAQCDQKYQPKGSYLTSSDLSGYATESWVGSNYQPKGNYLTSFTESDPTVPSHVKTITSNSISHWNSAYGWGDHSKAGYSKTDTTYSAATSTTYGLVKIGYASSGKNYAVQLSSGKMYVNVPWTDSGNTTYSAGNGLSLTGTEFKMSGSYTGTFIASGDVTAYSDERLKKNITTAPCDVIDQLRGVEFEWKEDGRFGSGVIAQELEQVLPHLVHDDNGNKSVNYMGLVGYLIEEVKALKKEVEALRDSAI